MRPTSFDRNESAGFLATPATPQMTHMLRWFSTTAVLFAALAVTASMIQFAVIGALDITFGRLVTIAAIAAAQGFAITVLLKKLDGGTR